MIAVVVVVGSEGGDGKDLRLMLGWSVAATEMARSELLHRPQPSCVLPSTKRECLR